MVATHPTSIAEFARVRREGLWELIEGVPQEVTPAAGASSRIGGRIYARLERFVEPANLGWVFPADAGFVLFPDRATVRSPDAAVVLRQRLPTLPTGFIPLAPDLAVEVLSPSDRMADAVAKVAMYLEAGVRLVWLVDPESRTVRVYRPNTVPRVVQTGASLTGDDVLPGFLLPVADIFA
ncbi:MAG: Uma2 family endonuclease [Thermomicrobiales bacterium]